MTTYTLNQTGVVGDTGAAVPILGWGCSRPTGVAYVPGVDSTYPFAWGPGAVAAASGSLNEAGKIRVWSSGTVRNFGIRLGTASALADITVMIQINGVDTSITTTIPTGATTANDTTHTASVTAGDTLNTRLIATAIENTALSLWIGAEQI